MIAINKGLAGVVVDDTAISKVDSATNSLLYRGYPVQELAATYGFERVAYLLWHGELPSAAELAEFVDFERGHRELDLRVKAIMDMLPRTAPPMDVLRTAVSAIGTFDPHSDDARPEANLRKAMRLYAQLPAIITYDQRRRRGEEYIAPRGDLGYSENFLYMAFGTVPGQPACRALDASLILYAESSLNASTFTARVITSTLSDIYSAVVGGISAIRGPLHGGANEAVIRAFEEIGDPANTDSWLEEALKQKRRIPGFGNRVYKKGDLRASAMEAALVALVHSYGRTDALVQYRALEAGMATRRKMKPNLDYPTAVAYNLLGFDTSAFTPIFAASRVVGWTAHVMEQLTANTLIHPLAGYTGARKRHVQVQAGQ